MTTYTHDSDEFWKKRRQLTWRINLFFFLTFALFVVLVGRLAILQFVNGPQFQVQQTRIMKRDVTITPTRGNIFDRNGAWIASTVSTQTLFYLMEPKQEADIYMGYARGLEAVFAQYGKPELAISAAKILDNMDVGYDIEGKATKRKPDYLNMQRRIKSGLTKDEMAWLSEHRDELPGFYISEESSRIYNPDQIAVQLVGFIRPFSTARSQLDIYKKTENEYRNDEYVGMDGLELMYQNELRGRMGRKSYPINAQREIVGQQQITPPVKGYNLILTIDKDVQQLSEEAIREHLKFLQGAKDEYYSRGKNAVSGYAVAMEVDTGRVVTMASIPDYDPNVWIGGLQQEQYDRIQYVYTNGAIRDRPPNLPTLAQRLKHPSSMVPPGSALKPLSVLVGLNEGLFTTRTKFEDEGFFYYGKNNNSRVNNSGGTPWGTITAVGALSHSSNTFMAAMIGDRLYKTKPDALRLWDSYMVKFGLGIPSGSGLPNENPGKAEYFNTKLSSAQAQLVFASYGQASKYTTLQLAQYTAMLANRGKRYKPLFVDKIVSYEGSGVVREEQPDLLDKIDLPASYWNTVERGLRLVNARGFEDAFSERVARKTGTSESEVPGGRVDNAVFIAYAPVEKPKLAVAVVVPEGGFGAYGAAPIARKIFDAYDKYIGLDTP